LFRFGQGTHIDTFVFIYRAGQFSHTNNPDAIEPKTAQVMTTIFRLKFT